MQVEHPVTISIGLRRVWSAADPASDAQAHCDAENDDRPHRRVATLTGDYWVCASCGQMHRRIIREDLHEEYEAHYERLIASSPPTDEQVARRARWLERFLPYQSTGRLLEIGSGLGVMLKAAVEQGWHAVGNELTKTASDFARDFSGAEVVTGPSENFTPPGRDYDVIILNNVMEHLRGPRSVLGRLAQSLRPGGVIYLQTLNGASLSLLARPLHWVYYYLDHLYVPTDASLLHYSRGAGLKMTWKKTHGFCSARHDAAQEATQYRRMSTGRRLADKLISGLAGRLGMGHRIECMMMKPEA